MSNIKISELPEFTGSVAGSWLVMDNSTQTTTYKVLRENIVSTTSGTSGTSGYNGTGGSSGSSGSSGISGTGGTSGIGLGISTKANTILTTNTGWTGNDYDGWKCPVVFQTPFGSTNYTPAVVSLNNTYFAGVSGSLSTTGFTLNASRKIDVNWSAVAWQETGVPGTSGTSGFSLFAQTGSVWNTTNNVGITGSLTVTGSAIITGSVQGNVNSLSISSNTASLNLNDGNFFNLQLVSGSSTHLNPSNIKPGQTVSIFVNTIGSATMTFPSSVKQISGSSYVPTSTTGIDILTLISKDTSSLYLVNAQNFI